MATDTDYKVASNGGASSYYALPEGATELYDLIDSRNMNFSVGNIFKAAYRLGRKAGNDDAYDLRKIIFAAARELARVTGKPTNFEEIMNGSN